MDLLRTYDGITSRLQASGDYIWPLALRTILFWEFWEAGVSKYGGTNWFASIPYADWQMGFPFPFNLLSTDTNWFLATWGELVFSLLLLFGLFTRFAAFSLLLITVVATAAVHWPAEWSSFSELWNGYVISADGAGNFKLPLLFAIMLLPLIFHGGGKISFDYLFLGMRNATGIRRTVTGDMLALCLGTLILGLATVFLIPVAGYAFLGVAILTGIVTKVIN